jgi:aminoglycoside phosphotransferase
MPSETISFSPGEKDKLDLLTPLDADRMAAVFMPIMRKRFGKNLQIKRVHIEVLRRRSKRCVLRYDINGFESDRKEAVQWCVIGKVLMADLGQKVYENMRQLWMHGFSIDAQDGISVPEPLEFISSLRMLLQAEVPGVSFSDLFNGSARKGHFQLLARALAKLHRCPIVPGKPFGVRDQLLRCHPKHEFLLSACPDQASSIRHIVERAYEKEEAFVETERTPLHGDFHLGQIHIEDGHAWLIDLDALSYGDPASDLGNLLVFMKAKTRRNPETNSFIQVFLDEYFSLMDHKIRARIPLYEGLTHLRRACKCMRFQREGWKRKAELMIEQGVACVDSVAVNGSSERNQ